MAIVPATAESSFPELGMDGSVESLVRLLDSQKKLLHSQADQLHRVVVTHCKLTGVNPLSQEMAAGALSIKMGKKPRDLLNPKAVKYMQSVFAIKDIIGKKETREISALFGVTVTQVREFFAGQRSKVRKLVCLAREKAARLDVLQAANERCSANPDATSLWGNDAVLKIDESTQVPANEESVAVCSVDAKPIQMALSSSSSHEETVPGIDEDDKKFLGNIFNLMRKEGTFSGQVKLMEWILQIHNSAVLVWFSTKGSIMILATWLSQAAIEEQTTVLNVILKVLCHLPLHKALPTEVSTVLQTVNKLRFYRTPDISNRARILLSRWSKMLVRNQTQKYPSASNSNNDVQKEIIRKQRINEILSDEFWRSKIGIPGNILALTENGGTDSKPIPRLAQKLLTSCDSYSRKQAQCASIRIKERRKVRLVEQLDQKPSVRIAQVGRAAPTNHCRPISADDIQKAKMRAMFMQHKYGKPDPSSNENKKIEEHNEGLTTLLQPKNISPAPGIMQPAPVNREEEKPAEVLPANQLKPTAAPRVDLSEMLKANRVQWRTPPEVKIDSLWRVGEAESSKELLVQAQRIRREKETFYSPPSQIPPNPKDPWDVEMDYDDSLTPEIPIEQPPDTEIADDPSDHHVADDQVSAEKSPVGDVPTQPVAAPPITAPVPVPAPTAASSGSAASPDLELLAVLLKNPELVFALTSGQGKNLTNSERVALLDMIKHSNALLACGTNGATSGASLEMPRESAPASLPSPTPPSDAERMNGWRSTFPAMAGAPLPQPQLSAAAQHSFPAQSAQTNTFISQRPIPTFHQPAPSSGYPVQERVNFEYSLRRDSRALNPISIPMLSPPPSFPISKPQPQMISEPSTSVFPPNPASWEWRDTNSIERRDTMAEFSARRPNAAESSANNNPYPRHHGGSLRSDSWSPEDSPVRSSELRLGRDWSRDGPRSGRGWNQRQEWSRQRPGHRDQYRSGGGGGGFRRHRDRDRRR